MAQHNAYPEAAPWDWTVMNAARRAIYMTWDKHRRSERNKPGGEWAVLNPKRDWYMQRYFHMPLHPVVDSFRKQWRPLDWQQLLLEHPYISEKDPSQIAFTPDEQKGRDDKQVIVRIGKYLQRHWPHVADHIRRDAVAAYSCDEISIVRTMEEIIQGIEMGPRSCMQSGYGSIPFDSGDRQKMVDWFEGKKAGMCEDELADIAPRWARHPYVVYDPALGWGMAVRKKDGVFMGRALVYEGKGQKCFVRTYARRSADDDQSSSDHTLHEWLKGQGYELKSCWPDGTPLRKLEHPRGGLFAPYIDGGSRSVSVDGDLLVIDDGGDYTCDNRDGTVDGSEHESIGECTRCGTTVYENDDYLNVGRDEDEVACETCSDSFTLVRGQARWESYREYYVRDAYATYVEGPGYYIDDDNPPDGVVQLHDGDWAEDSEAVSIDGDYYLADDDAVVCLEDGDYALADNAVQIDGEWYLEDDDRVVCRADGEYDLLDNCWMCDGSGEWYSEDDDEQKVELDSGTYHKEHLDSLVNAKQLPLPLPEPAPEPVPEPTPAPVAAVEVRPRVREIIAQVSTYSTKAAQWMQENHASFIVSGTSLDTLFIWEDTSQGDLYWRYLYTLTTPSGYGRAALPMYKCRAYVQAFDATGDRAAAGRARDAAVDPDIEVTTSQVPVNLTATQMLAHMERARGIMDAPRSTSERLDELRRELESAYTARMEIGRVDGFRIHTVPDFIDSTTF